MDDYNKIIESLAIRFTKSRKLDIIQPVHIDNYYDVENTIVLLHEGHISYERDKKLTPGTMLFIPAGKMVDLTYGNPKLAQKVTNEKFLNDREQFLKPYAPSMGLSSDQEYFSYVTFEAKVFDSVSFFTSLDIPPFVIEGAGERVAKLVREIVSETAEDKAGKSRLISLYTEELVIEIIRYILDNQLFVEQLATNSTYFKDPRLIDIFTFIKNNLSGDLSNKVLAGVANVSEDYVGQYFKMLTGINPQDYIEYQRMEMAVNLLRTTKKSIRAIGNEVGYKDTAYFCRRFKMMFGIPAGKMRRRESLII